MSTWPYLVNPFEVAARDNYLLQRKLSTYHINALLEKAGVPSFDEKIAYYQPRHTTYVNAYNAWFAMLGTRKGKTKSVKDLLAELSATKIVMWDVAIQNIHPRDTPRYLELLPNYRTPFQSGSRQSRIAALEALSQNIGAEAPLGAILTDVDDFIALIVAANTTQQGAKGAIIDLSNNVATASLACSVGQYRNLGAFIMEWPDDPSDAEAYFDMPNVRNKPQVIFVNGVAFLSFFNIAKRTMQPTKQLRLINTGTVPLTFFFAAEKNDTTYTISVTVAAGEEELVTASQLGNVPAATYLKVQNQDATTPGTFQVEVL